MPVTDPEVRRLRAQAGGFTRRGNPEAAAEARRQLNALQLERHIRRVVDAAPPLTDAQRERLALLLNPGAGSDAT